MWLRHVQTKGSSGQEGHPLGSISSVWKRTNTKIKGWPATYSASEESSTLRTVPMVQVGDPLDRPMSNRGDLRRYCFIDLLNGSDSMTFTEWGKTGRMRCQNR